MHAEHHDHVVGAGGVSNFLIKRKTARDHMRNQLKQSVNDVCDGIEGYRPRCRDALHCFLLGVCTFCWPLKQLASEV